MSRQSEINVKMVGLLKIQSHVFFSCWNLHIWTPFPSLYQQAHSIAWRSGSLWSSAEVFPGARRSPCLSSSLTRALYLQSFWKVYGCVSLARWSITSLRVTFKNFSHTQCSIQEVFLSEVFRVAWQCVCVCVVDNFQSWDRRRCVLSPLLLVPHTHSKRENPQALLLLSLTALLPELRWRENPHVQTGTGLGMKHVMLYCEKHLTGDQETWL